jgi:hypothetical protein
MQRAIASLSPSLRRKGGLAAHGSYYFTTPCSEVIEPLSQHYNFQISFQNDYTYTISQFNTLHF